MAIGLVHYLPEAQKELKDEACEFRTIGIPRQQLDTSCEFELKFPFPLNFLGVKFSADGNYSQVFVRGSFNNWAEDGQVELVAIDGCWNGQLKLLSGDYQMKFWALEHGGSCGSYHCSPHHDRVKSECGQFDNNFVSVD